MVNPPFTPLAPEDPPEIGGYRLVARLGAGGMGQVFLASTQSGRRLAVKVIRAEYTGDPEFRRRFQQEVAAVLRVQSLYTAPVVDADPHSRTPWLATAYVPGPSLDKAVAQHGPLPPHTVLTMVCGVAEALQAIHAVQVVHRDLKPSNVLLSPEGPRVIDFGIAKAVDATPLTGTGIRIGTPLFMAPEQALGHPAAPPVDVFALGGLALFAATGRTPFGEGPDPAVLYRVVHDEPQLDGCPPELRDLIARCLAKDPAHRPTPRALVAELERYAQPGPGPEWLPPPLTHALPAYAAPPSPPPARTRRTFGLGVVAGAAVAAAVVAAAVTAVLIMPGAADGTPLAQPAATVTVTQQAPATTATTGPSPDTDETTPSPVGTATEGSVAGAKAGTLLGTYKGIDVTRYYGVNFTDDPTHPKENEGDVEYSAIGLRADKMAVLDSGQNGTYQACVDNTKYMSSYEADQAKGRLVCVFGQSTIGLVKVTKVSEGDSNYITMDLTVWQR
ncbi:serine/threonine-protein kinase [Nonomuraea sp. NPDC049028]|uniref:serine/threonine-protein kinase n=1 Tax=Nonomuraea sp. NPDC049028 TaxID=3364348 RepID=UPI0037193BEE